MKTPLRYVSTFLLRFVTIGHVFGQFLIVVEAASMCEQGVRNGVKKKVNLVNSSQNEGLPPSVIDLSFDVFGSILWHSVWFSFDGSFSFHIFFRISNFFDLSITEET